MNKETRQFIWGAMLVILGYYLMVNSDSGLAGMLLAIYGAYWVAKTL